MSDATPFLEGAIRDIITASPYVGLHTGDPSGANEVTGGSYARVSVSFNSSGSEPTVLTNSAIVEFPVAMADWGVITHIAVYSAIAAGNRLVKSAVVTPKNIVNGDIVRFNPGDLVIEID